MTKFPAKLSAFALGLVAFGLASAQEPEPSPETLDDAFPSQASYSPYANRIFPTEVFCGETHLLTGMSMVAGAFGERLMPDDA